MGKNKMIAKSCPKCEMQVAVASKACKCGHTFFASRRAADHLPAVEDIRRRTGRVRRSQPQFYDAQHYQKQKRRSWCHSKSCLLSILFKEVPLNNMDESPKKRSLSSNMDEDYKGKEKETATARARRRRALRRAARSPAGSADRTRDPTPQLRPSQQARCTLILNEINRKMQAVTWQPPTQTPQA